MEQHWVPGKWVVLGTGKQRGLGTEPRWEEAQQQGGLLVGEIRFRITLFVLQTRTFLCHSNQRTVMSIIIVKINGKK